MFSICLIVFKFYIFWFQTNPINAFRLFVYFLVIFFSTKLTVLGLVKDDENAISTPGHFMLDESRSVFTWNSSQKNDADGYKIFITAYGTNSTDLR